MVIEQLHGLHATKVLLNTRFGVLNAEAKAAAKGAPRRRRSRSNDGQQNNKLIETLSRNIQLNNRKKFLQNLNERGGRKRRHSEGHVSAGMVQANSLTNLSVASYNTNFNRLKRSSSFTNLVSEGIGGRKLQMRGLNRGRGRYRYIKEKLLVPLRSRIQFNNPRSPVQSRLRFESQSRPIQVNQIRHKLNWQQNERGRGKGRKARGAITCYSKASITKEDLDEELDQYMSSRDKVLDKRALDKQLDDYRNSSITI